MCGFTREVLSALIANIETTELRRQQIAQHSLQPSTLVQVTLTMLSASLAS